MSETDNLLSPPIFPQSTGNVIDEYKIDESDLVIHINRYDNPRRGDCIIVDINEYISSVPFFITNEVIDEPFYQLTIPFSDIPLREFNVTYRIIDFAYNQSVSRATLLKLENTKPNPNPPPTPEIATIEVVVLNNGMPADGFSLNTFEVTAIDKSGNPVPNVELHITSDEGAELVIDSAMTNSKGQALISLSSGISGKKSIYSDNDIIGHTGKVKIGETYFINTTKMKLINVGMADYSPSGYLFKIQAPSELKNRNVLYKVKSADRVKNVPVFPAAIPQDEFSTDDQATFYLLLNGEEGGKATITATIGTLTGTIDVEISQ